MVGKSLFTNRLIDEKSPYLLQHAHNPVDWFPWGEEAFVKAKEEDKPIFLSIGYATCHWCHVMERESFEDVQIAKLLNEVFVNIKLDREERPDIDQIYMDFAQAMMTSSAGWPLNVLLTPDLYPFFATTYLPPRSISGISGLIELIQQIQQMWKGEERKELLSQAYQVVELLKNSSIVSGEEMPDLHYPAHAVVELSQLFDTAYGGMKGAPKFPIGYLYGFLLHYSFLEQDSRALYMVNRTLESMYRGGIYDHLGGGFSRYSVDEQWLVPHFEKMLYDNALLAECYCDAWKFTKQELYQIICIEVIDYVLNNLTGPSGEFLSAEDADSEGKEGKFYTWTRDEMDQVLGLDDGELFSQIFGITSIGNFEGRNILFLPQCLSEFAEDKQFDREQLNIKVQELKKKLVKSRETRPHPLKDDKVLSSWSGLMIHSIVEAGRCFSIHSYVKAGVKAAQFIYDHLWKEDSLYRRFRDGDSRYRAGLDEYAMMIRAALTLFESGCGSKWLDWAMQMEKILREEFKVEGGAFYQTDGHDPFLILRKCDFSDGAEPSGNAIHCENLLRLYLLTYNPLYKLQAEDIFKAGKRYFEQYSPGYSYHYRNLLRYYQQKSPTIVVSLNDTQDYRYEIEKILYEAYLPHRGIVWKESNDFKLLELIPSVKGQPCIDNKTTIYVCYDRVCERPLTELVDIKLFFEKLR